METCLFPPHTSRAQPGPAVWQVLTEVSVHRNLLGRAGLGAGAGGGLPPLLGAALKKTGDRAHLAGLWRDLPSGSQAHLPAS